VTHASGSLWPCGPGAQEASTLACRPQEPVARVPLGRLRHGSAWANTMDDMMAVGDGCGCPHES